MRPTLEINLHFQEQHYSVYRSHALMKSEIELGENVVGGRINSMVSGKHDA